MVEDTFVSFVPTSSGDCANAIYISLRVLKNTRFSRGHMATCRYFTCSYFVNNYANKKSSYKILLLLMIIVLLLILWQ